MLKWSVIPPLELSTSTDQPPVLGAPMAHGPMTKGLAAVQAGETRLGSSLPVNTSGGLVTSRFGLRLMTIREDEVAAEAMGIDTFRYKLYAFLLSAVAPGIAGGLAARDQGYIEPISVFPLATTITMIVMVLFGGKGTIWGPVLGAVILFAFQEIVWAKFIYLHQLLFGAIIVVVVLLMPRGILGVLQQKYNLPRTI